MDAGMKKLLIAGLAGLAALMTSPAIGGDRAILGWGRLFTNDILGDGKDRWRSGSYTVSQVRGQTWGGDLPTFGEILEYRLQSQIISSANLANPLPTDRRYAGVLSFGIHTHFALAGMEASLGGDLVVTGPQNGVGRFQSWAHGIVGAPKPGGLGQQIGNGVYPTLVAEVGKTFALSDKASVRPFAELRAGDETLVRFGGDLVVGELAQGSLMLRDGVTGQRYRAVRGTGADGLSFVLGGDVAAVATSVYLPGADALELSPTRARARAGLYWQGERFDLFYGLTWLSREFETQPEGQTLGSVNLRIRF